MPIPTYTGGCGGARGPDLAASHRARKKGTKAVRSTATHLDIRSQLLDAVHQEKSRVVQRLLDTRADPNCCNAQSETPLMVACSVQNEDARKKILQMLMRKGANVNAQDKSGQTALMKAVIMNDIDTTVTFLEAHSDVSLEDSDGNNVLCHAARLGHEEMLQRLVREFKRNKVSVDQKNMHGLTPLLLACQEGHLICARILVCEGGASPTIRDLDNFMNAEEWMRLSGFFTTAELAFLSPSTQRKNYYRKERQKRGIKTLADFLPTEESCSSPNVFSIRTDVNRNSASFPVLSDHNSDMHNNPTPSSSMFDTPTASKRHKTPGYAMGKPVPMKPFSNPEIKLSAIKADLYHSPYLAQRKNFLSQNRRSQFYRRGSLEPISAEPLEKLRHLEPDFQGNSLDEVAKHTVLPPLKRCGSK